MGGNGADGDVVLFAEGGDNATLERSTIHLGGAAGDIRAGGNTVNGALTLQDDRGVDCIRLQAGNGQALVGGTGIDGELLLFANTGVHYVADTASIHLDAAAGNLRMGGRGQDGDVILREAFGDDRIRLDAGEGNVYLGGNGVDGDLLLFAESGDNITFEEATIHLNGQDGDIILRNADCAEEFDFAADEAFPGTVVVIGDDGRLHPSATGSLGIAISEAVEVAATNDDTNYALGSVLNHVLLHQTVIGLEAKAQMALTGEEPDVIIGCVGGGSNYAGIAYPFMADKLSGAKPDLRFVAAEPAACPTLTKGTFAYDFGDTVGMVPLLPMYTLGHGFVPAPVHAGGLRYHGDAPSLSLLVKHGHMEAKAYSQNQIFEAGVRFAKTQGIIPAPEPSHAIAATIQEAIDAREAGEERVILFNLCGHGHFDMQAYDDYLHGRLPELEFELAEEAEALAGLPEAPAIA